MRILWLMPALLGCMVAWAATDPPTVFPEPARLPVLGELPDPFLLRDGGRVSTPAEWERRRVEIREMLLHKSCGRIPPVPESILVEN